MISLWPFLAETDPGFAPGTAGAALTLPSKALASGGGMAWTIDGETRAGGVIPVIGVPSMLANAAMT